MNKKLLFKTLIPLTIVTTSVMGLGNAVYALSFGEVLGIGAGAILIDRAINNNRDRHQFRSPEEEYRRGLEDGFNLARYDNPRNSGDYDRGFNEGRRRAANGWRTPFQKA